MSSTANNAGSSLSKLVDFSGHGMEGLSKVCSIRGRFCVLTGDGMYLENGLSLGQFR